MTAPPPPRSTSGRTAVALAGAVLGVGALFLPGYAHGRLGAAALVAWAWQLAAGALLVAALALAAGELRGVAQLAGAALHPAAGAAVRWYYGIGVSVGQAVVAAVGGWFAARAVGHPGGWAPAAAVLLTAAALAAAAGWSGRVAPTATLVLTLLAALLTARAVPLPWTVDDQAGLGPAAFMLLFAFVGWEATLRLGRPADRAVCVGLGAGVALVAVTYAVLALLAGTGTAAPPEYLLRGGAALAALLCALACVRNLTTVAGLLAAPGTGRLLPLAPAAVAGVGLALLARHRVNLIEVLAVPNVMAAAVFCTAAAAVLAAGPARARPLAAAALLAYVALGLFSWPVLLVPLAVLLAALILLRPRAGHERRPARPGTADQTEGK